MYTQVLNICINAPNSRRQFKKVKIPVFFVTLREVVFFLLGSFNKKKMEQTFFVEFLGISCLLLVRQNICRIINNAIICASGYTQRLDIHTSVYSTYFSIFGTDPRVDKVNRLFISRQAFTYYGIIPNERSGELSK